MEVARSGEPERVARTSYRPPPNVRHPGVRLGSGAVIDQAKGVGGVYATQVLPFADVKSLPLFYAFEKAVYDG